MVPRPGENGCGRKRHHISDCAVVVIMMYEIVNDPYDVNVGVSLRITSVSCCTFEMRGRVKR
jgi:hypothetical protein